MPPSSSHCFDPHPLCMELRRPTRDFDILTAFLQADDDLTQAEYDHKDCYIPPTRTRASENSYGRLTRMYTAATLRSSGLKPSSDSSPSRFTQRYDPRMDTTAKWMAPHGLCG